MALEEVSYDLPRAGLALHGRRYGTAAGRPVLCLHGWLDNCASFDLLAEALPELDLIAIDLPGHGLSSRLPSATCQILDYAACVVELAATQGWQRFNLIGHSMGAMIGALAAGLDPGRIERFVLIDATIQRAADPDRLRSSAARYLAAYLKEDAPRPLFRSREQAARTRAKSSNSLLDTAERLSERDLVATPQGYTWSTDIRLRHPYVEALTEEQMAAFVHAITAPILVLNGAHATGTDGFDPAWVAPGTELRQLSLPGGHHLHMENVEPVAREIRSFLV